MPAKTFPLSKSDHGRNSILPTTLYRQLIRRNREIDKIIRMLEKEQESNGLKVLALVLKYSEVKRIHRLR